VVPEIAARAHLELLLPVVDRALVEGGCTYDDVDGIAVTVGPGLVGALLVGVAGAKALAHRHASSAGRCRRRIGNVSLSSACGVS